MKVHLKIFQIFILAILLSICDNSNMQAQTLSNQSPDLTAVNDSLSKKVAELEQTIKDGSYTRIPNEDFENILDSKIQKSMREIVNWWLFIIAALISLLGFLVNKYAKSYLQTTIEGKVNQLKTENEETIRALSSQYFSTAIDSLLDFKIETIAKNNHRVKEPVVNDLKGYLSDESVKIPEYKKVSLIDTIMRCYYHNQYSNRLEKMIDLIKQYEAKFTLMATTYANAAIAFNDMYDRYGSKTYLDDAIENCNKSLKILPDYGLAFALKLELNIMAITKAFDDKEKTHYELGLLKVFKDIENNQSTYLCNELVKRLEVDKKSFMEAYLKKLYGDYPDEMSKIEARAKREQK